MTNVIYFVIVGLLGTFSIVTIAFPLLKHPWSPTKKYIIIFGMLMAGWLGAGITGFWMELNEKQKDLQETNLLSAGLMLFVWLFYVITASRRRKPTLEEE